MVSITILNCTTAGSYSPSKRLNMYIYLQAVILSCSQYCKHADLQLRTAPPPQHNHIFQLFFKNYWTSVWSRDQRAFSACCTGLLVLVRLSFLTTEEHPDVPFSHNLIWKVNDSDDLLMTQINKPRESWHCYSLRSLSEVKWQYHSSQSALKERHILL